MLKDCSAFLAVIHACSDEQAEDNFLQFTSTHARDTREKATKQVQDSKINMGPRKVFLA
jgi:hypothetical protein